MNALKKALDITSAILGFFILCIISFIGNLIAPLFDPAFWTFLMYYWLFCIVVLIFIYKFVLIDEKEQQRRDREKAIEDVINNIEDDEYFLSDWKNYRD